MLLLADTVNLKHYKGLQDVVWAACCVGPFLYLLSQCTSVQFHVLCGCLSVIFVN